MKIGGIDIVNPMRGSTPIMKVMRGSVLIWERSSGYLLDDLATPIGAAWSLRKIKSDANDIAEIRRVTDSAITIVSFGTFNEISLDCEVSAGGTLGDWVGSGDATVIKWFDQTGNGNDFYTNNEPSQPKLINNGALIISGNKPTIDFHDSDKHLVVESTPDVALDGDMALYAVAQADGGNDMMIIGKAYEVDNVDYEIRVEGSTVKYRDDNNTVDATKTISGQSLYAFDRLANTNVKLRVDGEESTHSLSGTQTVDNIQVYIGERWNGEYELFGYFSEAIILKANGYAEKDVIETDITNYYGINLEA